VAAALLLVPYLYEAVAKEEAKLPPQGHRRLQIGAEGFGLNHTRILAFGRNQCQAGTEVAKTLGELAYMVYNP